MDSWDQEKGRKEEREMGEGIVTILNLPRPATGTFVTISEHLEWGRGYRIIVRHEFGHELTIVINHSLPVEERVQLEGLARDPAHGRIGRSTVDEVVARVLIHLDRLNRSRAGTP